MGNSAECGRCCHEDKKTEVDVHQPSYAASTSYMTDSARRKDEGDDRDYTPTFGDSTVKESPSPSEPWSSGGHGRGTAADAPETTHEPVTPISSPRTAEEWAKAQDQFVGLPPLPEGWIRVKSRTSGVIYFCCKETGETTFVHPSGVPNSAISMDLQDGWVEMQSRSTGRVYYWNAVLQKSQFEKPFRPSEAQSPRPGGDDEGLQEGWVSLISSKTGSVYYFNSRSQRSQYDRPTAKPAA